MQTHYVLTYFIQCWWNYDSMICVSSLVNILHLSHNFIYILRYIEIQLHNGFFFLLKKYAFENSHNLVHTQGHSSGTDSAPHNLNSWGEWFLTVDQ